MFSHEIKFFLLVASLWYQFQYRAVSFTKKQILNYSLRYNSTNNDFSNLNYSLLPEPFFTDVLSLYFEPVGNFFLPAQFVASNSNSIAFALKILSYALSNILQSQYSDPIDQNANHFSQKKTWTKLWIEENSQILQYIVAQLSLFNI